MSEAPERITAWLSKDGSTRFEGGRLFPAGVEVEYIRADRIEELEKRNASLESLIKDFFTLLDKTEETDEGRVFRPNHISSCRVQDGQKLENLLRLMKATLEDRQK